MTVRQEGCETWWPLVVGVTLAWAVIGAIGWYFLD